MCVCPYVSDRLVIYLHCVALSLLSTVELGVGWCWLVHVISSDLGMCIRYTINSLVSSPPGKNGREEQVVHEIDIEKHRMGRNNGRCCCGRIE